MIIRLKYLKAEYKKTSKVSTGVGIKGALRKNLGKMKTSPKVIKQYVDLKEIQKKGIVLGSTFDWTFEGEDKEYDEEYKDFI